MGAVRTAAKNDNIGEFLGYGLAHWSEPGAVSVKLLRPDGSLLAGFVSSGDSAEEFAEDRAKDYSDALGIKVVAKVERPDVAPASQNADAGLNSQEELNRGKPSNLEEIGSKLEETPPSAPLRPEEGGGINPTHVAKMRDSIRKAMGRLGPSAFPKGYAYTLLEHGGGLAYQEGKLLIDLNRLHGTLRNAGAKRIEAAVVEEYIHHLTTTEFQHGELEALWQRMPDSLKQTVRNAYFAAEIAAGAPIPADVDTPFNMGHEFLRMVIQDKAFAGTITESVNVPKSLVAELIRLLKQLARRLKGEIAKAPQAVREDIQNYVDKILTRINTLDAGAVTMSSRPSGRGGSSVEVGATARQGTVTASEPSSAGPVESLDGDGIALGSAGTVHTGTGEPIEFTWAAVEAGRLVVSNHDDGSPNAAYDQSLQGRNRNTAASELNVQDIANNTTFSRLSESGETSGGAPIVGPDLQVESGNGRTMGIRRAYSRKLPNVAGYKADLVANAGRFGLDSEAIAAMGAPVLVRVRRSEVDRVAFAEDANRATVSQMSAREVALQDLANLPDGVFGSLDVSEDGDIYTPANEGFFRRFFQSAVTPGELPALIDANGRLTQQGLDRMRNALFVAAYGSNESGMLAFARMAENPAPEFRNLVKAMMGAAPQFAQMNSMIGAGALPDLSISGDVAAAANAFVELRRRGESVQDYLDQGQLVADGVTPFQRELLSWIDSSLRAPRKMAETLGNYATLLSRQDNPGQGQLFEAEPASKEQLWEQAKAADGSLDPAEGMLFSASVPDLSSGAFANPPSQTTFVEDESGNHDGRTEAGQARGRMVEGVRVLRADAGWLEHSEVRSFEERTGSRVQFYSKPSERHVAGYTDVRRGTENLIFVNVEADSRLGNTLAHEWGHLASHDPDSGFAELESQVHSLLTPEEVAVIEDGLRESGYRPDQFRRETTAFLIGDALGGTDFVGLSHLTNAEAIRDAIRQFYNDAPPLNPSSLVQSAEDELARRKAVQLADDLLAKLPANARSVVAGVAEGRDFHDIGEEVGLSADEAEKLYRNTTRIVKAKLDREMPDRPALFAGDVSQDARKADTSSERVEKTAKSMHMATVPSAPLGDRSLPPVELTLEGWNGSASDLSRLARDVYTRELQGTSVMNADMGESVAFTSEGKSEAFGARGKMRVPVRAELVKVLRDLVGSAVKVAESPPAKGREGDSKGFRTLVAPMSVNGSLFAVKVTVRVPRKDGAGLKFYDVTTAEMQRGPDVNGVGEEASLRPSPFGASGPTVAELASAFNIDLPGTALYSASPISPEDQHLIDDGVAELSERIPTDRIDALAPRAPEMMADRAAMEQHFADTLDAAAFARDEKMVRETFELWDERAKLEIEHDRAGVILRLLESANRGEGIRNAVDTRAAMMLLPEMRAAAMASRDPRKLAEVQALEYAYLEGGGENARAMAARRFSPYRSVAERHLAYLGSAMARPPKSWAKRIEAALTPAAKAAEIARLERQIKDRMTGPGTKPAEVQAEVKRLAEQLDQVRKSDDRNAVLTKAATEKLERIEKELTASGISLAEIFNHEAVVKLRSGSWLKKQLERYSQTERKAIRAMVNGLDPKGIARESGIAPAGIEGLRQRFAAHMREEFGKLADRGMTLADFDGGLAGAIGGAMDASGRLHSASVPPADAKAAEEAQKARDRVIGQFEEALGLTDKQWEAQKKGRTKAVKTENGEQRFDPTKLPHVLQVMRAMQAAEGTNGFDLAYEYWINGILSGPQTHVVNITGNFANVAFEYGAQRWMEAAMNSLPGMKDPNGATFKEMRWMIKALPAAWSKAWRMASVAWNTEISPFEADVLGQDIDYVASKAEHQKLAWGGKFGRTVRIPGRALNWMDTAFKYFVGQVEVAAQAYRIANSEGLRGSALDSRIAALVGTPGSAAWIAAMHKAQELTYTAPLKSAAEGGGFVEGLVRKVQDARIDRSGTVTGSAVAFAVGLFFPFVRTPYNIFKTGLRRTPFAAFPTMAKLLKAGFFQVRHGKPFFESYSKVLMARDMVDQMVAWTMTGLLMGMVEGDGDDDEKPILLTGSRPYGIEQGGDREHLDRLHGGAFQIRWKWNGRNHYFDFGRQEPWATTVGTIADTLRGIKRVQHGKPWMDETGKLFSYMLDQAQEKTFLQGFASIVEWMNDPEKKAGGLPRTLLQAIVPNFVRQPLRNLDDYARDSKTAPLYYHALPYGGWAQPKLDLWGNPIEKATFAGSSKARVLFDVGLQPYETPVRGDELIRNWNRENPDDPFFPTPTRADTWQDTMKRTHKMTPEQRQEFLRRVGETFERKVRMEISPAEARNPSEQTKNKMKQLRDAATSEVKRQMVASGLLRPAA